MTKEDIIEKIKCSELDLSQVIVISGAALVLHGVINETFDIDFTCSKEYYDSLQWEEKLGYFKLPIKYFEDFEISNNLYSNNPVDIIDGIKCMNLEDCLILKELTNREKDKETIKKLKMVLSNMHE